MADVVTIAHLERAQEALERAQRGGAHGAVRIKRLRKDGSTFEVTVSQEHIDKWSHQGLILQSLSGRVVCDMAQVDVTETYDLLDSVNAGRANYRGYVAGEQEAAAADLVESCLLDAAAAAAGAAAATAAAATNAVFDPAVLAPLVGAWPCNAARRFTVPAPFLADFQTACPTLPVDVEFDGVVMNARAAAIFEHKHALDAADVTKFKGRIDALTKWLCPLSTPPPPFQPAIARLLKIGPLLVAGSRTKPNSECVLVAKSLGVILYARSALRYVLM